MLSEKTILRNQTVETKTNNNWVSHADEISIETVVNILVEKGICTADEIFMLEGKIRDEKVYNKEDASFVSIKSTYNRGRFSGLKRSMSKHRWSRRLGSWLFGWKWKKVKKSPSF